MQHLSFGIIGAGLIGGKRAAALKELGAKISAVYDIDAKRATTLAQTYGAHTASSLNGLLKNPEINAVIIATSNDAVAPAIIAASQAGKAILVEKPAGRNPAEILGWVNEVEKNKTLCRVGFNHRFHPGMLKMKSLLTEEAIGPLMYFRARYGHGGRIGYDKEWRADPKLGGGGELIDQGVHLVDLCRWLGGEFDLEFGRAHTYYWNMPVDDNGFLLLKAPKGNVRAWLHASCTEWKNIFSFEVYGKKGKLEVTGLGKSYGEEALKFYKVKPEMGVPDLETFTFPPEDTSWAAETRAFVQELEGKSTPIAKPRDALRAVELVYDTYRASDCSWV